MVETISREDAAWLAGMIEGDGSFYINRHKLTHDKVTFRSVVCVSNSDARVIQAVSKIWFALGCKFYYQLQKKPSGKFSLTIICCGKGSTDRIISTVLPYLRAKLDQALLLQEFNEEMRKCHYKRMEFIEYQKLQTKYIDRLLSLRVTTVNPQRLQRVASKVLELGEGIV